MEQYSLKNPFPATVVAVRPVTKPGSAKETHQIDLSLDGSGMAYTAGDVLGVLPMNDPELVDALIACLGLKADESVALPSGAVATLREALITAYDISSIKKGLLSKWNAVAQSAKLAAIIEDTEQLRSFSHGRDLLDLAEDPETTAKFEDATQFVSCLGKLTPRLYSIASSPDYVPGQVSLCVGAVRYNPKHSERPRKGVCSIYLADRVKTGDKVRVFVQSKPGFHLPENPATPIIMVGPGAGIAPFRAFWQQRTIDKAEGDMWFFFGNPHQATDACYEDEINELVTAGKMRYSAAWSRDQDHKVYVQHLMEQNAADVWKWLNAGAYFYMCGDAARMAKDVEAALLGIISSQGNLSPEEAAEYLAAMQKDKRYRKDVY